MRISHYKFIPEDVKSVYEGHEVAVHSLTHPTLTELSEEEIIREVDQDRINLEKLVGYDIVGMAYPNGPNDDRVAEILKNKTTMDEEDWWEYVHDLVSEHNEANFDALYYACENGDAMLEDQATYFHDCLLWDERYYYADRMGGFQG